MQNNGGMTRVMPILFDIVEAVLNNAMFRHILSNLNRISSHSIYAQVGLQMGQKKSSARLYCPNHRGKILIKSLS